ncbi:hypothetical protein AGABI1DRAFT_125372 [Agaricus bisporus var. burnettii JB137-S8]|uniref:Uncharacterized protein n=1 Tax=Agaricus bisporus var. burnettii (strain JB137-S8 / ATCC MYA-4627 / FGSC 10392) TaxID=597362 RepID=K5X4W9_AGABU|nr:uncharacterized protein AGABI1DRAFT_125372 [Agaricus bisporus var. burnettii JB137-S8]EKM82906.1 hypothetical protein AGABI1DRAFT_125372 [Agaricus bisporus var. burnettii JB137-S8]
MRALVRWAFSRGTVCALTHVDTFSEANHPLYSQFVDCMLRATHTLIKRRDLDGYNVSSVAGISSFSEQLAKIIGMVDPLPPAFEPTPPPPTPSGTAPSWPRSPSADMDMTPRKTKKAKPTPLLNVER